MVRDLASIGIAENLRVPQSQILSTVGQNHNQSVIQQDPQQRMIEQGNFGRGSQFSQQRALRPAQGSQFGGPQTPFQYGENPGPSGYGGNQSPYVENQSQYGGGYNPNAGAGQGKRDDCGGPGSGGSSGSSGGANTLTGIPPGSRFNLGEFLIAD